MDIKLTGMGIEYWLLALGAAVTGVAALLYFVDMLITIVKGASATAGWVISRILIIGVMATLCAFFVSKMLQ